MKETIDTIIAWHKNTFKDASLEGQKEKWQEEYNEFVKTQPGSQDELYEIADMIIVSCGIMRFDYALGLDYLCDSFDKGDYIPDEKWEAVEEKQAKNRKRVWNKTGNGTYHHKNGIED